MVIKSAHNISARLSLLEKCFDTTECVLIIQVTTFSAPSINMFRLSSAKTLWSRDRNQVPLQNARRVKPGFLTHATFPAHTQNKIVNLFFFSH